MTCWVEALQLGSHPGLRLLGWGFGAPNWGNLGQVFGTERMGWVWMALLIFGIQMLRGCIERKES